MPKIRLVSSKNKKEKKEFKSSIDKWLYAAKEFENNLDLKEYSRLSNKEFKKLPNIKLSDDGKRYKIESKNMVIELWFYYDNPHKYYSDLFKLIGNLRSCIHSDYKSIDVWFSFSNEDDRKRMSTIHFVYNMIMWLPFFILDIPITDDLIFMPKVFNNKTYIKYVNEKIIEPNKHLVTMNQMSQILSKMYDLFIRIFS